MDSGLATAIVGGAAAISTIIVAMIGKWTKPTREPEAEPAIAVQAEHIRNNSAHLAESLARRMDRIDGSIEAVHVAVSTLTREIRAMALDDSMQLLIKRLNKIPYERDDG